MNLKLRPAFKQETAWCMCWEDATCTCYTIKSTAGCGGDDQTPNAAAAAVLLLPLTTMMLVVRVSRPSSHHHVSWYPSPV
jgi:hypothetical protein